jgi:hypothetical protein
MFSKVKQQIAITFRCLIKTVTFLVFWGIFLIHLTVLAPQARKWTHLFKPIFSFQCDECLHYIYKFKTWLKYVFITCKVQVYFSIRISYVQMFQWDLALFCTCIFTFVIRFVNVATINIINLSLCILCMLMIEFIPLLTLTLICTWYAESIP